MYNRGGRLAVPTVQICRFKWVNQFGGVIGEIIQTIRCCFIIIGECVAVDGFRRNQLPILNGITNQRISVCIRVTAAEYDAVFVLPDIGQLFSMFQHVKGTRSCIGEAILEGSWCVEVIGSQPSAHITRHFDLFQL